MEAFWAAPPITRTITAVTVLLSATVWAGILPPYYVAFIRPWVLRLPFPQLWRLVSPFFITGPQLGLIFDPYFLWTHGKALETGSSRFSDPADFFVYIVFVCTCIIVSLPRSNVSPLPILLRIVPLMRNLEISARPVSF